MKLRRLVVGLFILVALGSPVWALYCTGCGIRAADDARFCAQCGKPLPGVVVGSPSPENLPAGAAGTPRALAAPPSPQAFQVTTHHLQINGYRISRNGLFWIAEIRGNRARIWCVNEFPPFGIVMGWVALAELEKRTTLKPDATIYCVEPPPPSAEIVVIQSRPYWRHWHPQSRRYHSR